MRDLKLAEINETGEHCAYCREALAVGRIVGVEGDKLLCDFDCWAKLLKLIPTKGDPNA